MLKSWILRPFISRVTLGRVDHNLAAPHLNLFLVIAWPIGWAFHARRRRRSSRSPDVKSARDQKKEVPEEKRLGGKRQARFFAAGDVTKVNIVRFGWDEREKTVRWRNRICLVSCQYNWLYFILYLFYSIAAHVQPMMP